MTICSFAGTKGGIGKSTLAVNFAIGLTLRGQNVLLVDGDQQRTAMAFTHNRRTKHPDAVVYAAAPLHGQQIRDQVTRYGPDYDQVVIDVGGRDSSSLRAALLVSDLVIIPCAPRSFDLWGVGDMLEVVREARAVRKNLRALAVLNNADHAGNRNQEALEALRQEEGLEVYPGTIGRRTAYPSAADEGLSVLEYIDPNNRPGSLKAREDFTRLLETIYPKLEWRQTA